LKASPNDRVIRKEIEAAQRQMESIQKDLRRESFSLQRELALSVAMIDKLADSVRRLCEAEASEGLKRVLKTLVAEVRELYAGLEATRLKKNIVDPGAWEKSAAAEIEQAVDFYDAYARAGYQAMLAVEAMTLAVSERPPMTAEEATRGANEAVAARIKTITARFTGS
jgi:hypothetical protein